MAVARASSLEAAARRALQTVPMLLLLLLGATAAPPAATFEQLSSTRMYLRNARVSPRVASWPVLEEIATAPQLLAGAAPSTTNASAAWALLRGELLLLETTGRARAVVPSGGGLPSSGATSGAACGNGVLVVAAAQELVALSCHADTATCVATKRVALHSGQSGAVAPAVACDGTAAWVAPASAGCVFSADLLTGAAKKFDSAIAYGNVTALAVSRGRVAVGTETAVFDDFDASLGAFRRHTDVGDLIDAPPRAVAFVGNDLWIGHQWCLNVVRGDTGWVDRVSGAQGLPVGNISGLAVGGDSTRPVLWISSTTGAVRYAPSDETDKWRFFSGDRWVVGLGTPVISLAVDGSGGGGAWIATEAAGVAHIVARQTTFEAKAAAYLRHDVPRLDRYGWVAAAGLKAYGDSATTQPQDGDNDGLWTGMLVAALSLQYTLTRDETVRSMAWRHFSAVEFLHNVTRPAQGFIARSAVRCGEPHQFGDGTICPSGSPNTCGWVNSTQCYAGVDTSSQECCWVWKRDTSSDEVDGHVFALSIAHDHLATTAAERVRIAEPMCRMVAHIVDAGFLLVDPITGRHTTWGYWDPATLNKVPNPKGDRGLNSLEILSYLASAARICDGNEALSSPKGNKWKTFGEAFVYLVRDHGYDRNMVNAFITSPNGIAFFDYRLAFLSYHTLLAGAPEITLHNGSGKSAHIPLTAAEGKAFQRQFQSSLMRYWGDTASPIDGLEQRVPALSLVYEYATGKPGLADPSWQLRRYPDSPIINWPTNNSARLDVALDREWLRCAAKEVSTRVLPADEAFNARASDFLTEASTANCDGGGGNNGAAPNPWLLVYWLSQHYKSSTV